MALRTVALCDGKHIGIETIYTVINGYKINIPEKLKELRVKSRTNELFCPCGCGSNLILVAGDKNLRAQHFRLKSGDSNQNCNATTEGKASLDSKIVLKCWLDDKLKDTNIESRVPIQDVDDIDRKYEFSFLSREKKIALSYCYKRENLSDDKIEILESNTQGIHVIYVIDSINGGSNGQYPEWKMKIQIRQGYCLFLTIDEAEYNSAKMRAVFYAKNIDGLWQEIPFADGKLSEFSITDPGGVTYASKTLDSMKEEAEERFNRKIETERTRRLVEKRHAEKLKILREEEAKKRNELRKEPENAKKEQILLAEEVAKRRIDLERKQRLDEELRQDEIRMREEDFRRNIVHNLTQQETPVRDAEGKRWIKCEFCGKIAKENEFSSYGGEGHVNLGTCNDCLSNNPSVNQNLQELIDNAKSKNKANNCPECGGKLLQRNGRFGRFWGCSNYPACSYTRKI